MAKGTKKSPSGRTSAQERPPIDIGNKGGKGKGKAEAAVKGSIRQGFQNAKQTLLRQLDLQQTLDQQLLGLTKDGDTRPEVLDIIKKLKKRKKT